MKAFSSFDRVPTLGAGSRARAANLLRGPGRRGRAGGTRAPGTGHRAQCRATLRADPHPRPPATPARPRPARTSPFRSLQRRAPSGEEVANPGSPSAAPTSTPRLNDELSKKSAGAGGMFGGQTPISSSAFLKGNCLRPRRALVERGKAVGSRVAPPGMTLPLAAGVTQGGASLFLSVLRTSDGNQP